MTLKFGLLLSLIGEVFFSFSSVKAEQPIVAVFDVEVKGIEMDAGTLDRLTDYLCSLLAQKGNQVVPRAKLKESLQEKKKESYKQCFNQACQIEIGQELAAQKSLSTQVLKLGKECKVTLTLFDLKRSTSEKGTTVSGGCDEDGIVKSMEKAVADMMGMGAGTTGAQAKTPDLGEYEKLAATAAAEEAKQKEVEKKSLEERRQYLASLEKFWESVKKVAATKAMSQQSRSGIVRKFLQDFPKDNPHEREAKGWIASLDQGKEPQTAGDLVWVHSNPAGIDFTKSEVTVVQYRACVEAGKCSMPKSKDAQENCNWGYSDRDNHPVNCVDWNQATAFCDWAGGRLPTDDEWSAEASNGGKRKFPWGDQEVSCDYAVWMQGGEGCGRNSTWPVCAKARGNSVSGLCDMSGNVLEWTSTGDGSSRGMNGGSWFGLDPHLMQASYRSSGSAPTLRLTTVGFRCGRSAKP
jgi:hypothetical protein